MIMPAVAADTAEQQDGDQDDEEQRRHHVTETAEEQSKQEDDQEQTEHRAIPLSYLTLTSAPFRRGQRRESGDGKGVNGGFETSQALLSLSIID
jgi:hypothetical protein